MRYSTPSGSISATPSRAEPGDSGGLGLVIVQSIMQLHGGQVRVSSDASGTVLELGFEAI
jgi:two-component system heavy metal sensor histidine kinase CusS